MGLTATLTLPPTDYDDDGDLETAEFVLTDNIRLTHLNRTGYLIEGGSNIISVLAPLFAQAGIDLPSDGRDQQFKVDLGGGEHVTELEGQVAQGSPNQWGTGDGNSVWDKTGAPPVEQIQLLDRCIQLAKIDSASPATLSVGMYGDELPALHVAPEQPELSFDSEQESSTATISIGLVEIASLTTPTSQLQDNR